MYEAAQRGPKIFLRDWTDIINWNNYEGNFKYFHTIPSHFDSKCIEWEAQYCEMWQPLILGAGIPFDNAATRGLDGGSHTEMFTRLLEE